jgi:PEP-CTERM motif
MKKNLFLVTLALAASAAAQAAAPTATSLTAGLSFAEYSGDTKVGSGNVNVDDTLFFIDEAVSATAKSWYLFFDPTATRSLQATISFDAPIVGILRSRNQLSQSNSTYRVDVDGDGLLNDYANVGGTGMEKADIALWTPGQNTITLNWATNASGDHLRVLTAVPEPSTYALLAGGLFAIGLHLRARRKNAR